MTDALVTGDDGLPADEVGVWVEEKHRVLTLYLNYQAKPRSRFLGARKGGATYIEVFCGAGRSRVRDTTRFVDGSPVGAWNASVADKAPFSAVYIADKDETRREACAERLRRLGAPVVEIKGEAVEAARTIVSQLDKGLKGLHFAFVDPYSLGALKLDILRALATIHRMDMLVHVSAMDLYRNIDKEVAGDSNEFEAFAPGLIAHVSRLKSRDDRRRGAMDYWREQVAGLGMLATPQVHQIRNSVNRDLYWLMLVTRHDLAKRFWKIVLNSGEQRDFLNS